MVNKSEIKRSYYLNLFSGNAAKTDNINEVNASIISGYSSLVGGSGYTEAPLLTVNGTCAGFVGSTRLTATTVDSTNFTIVNRGSGYTTGNTLVFDNTETGGANLNITVVATSGLITGFTLLSGGSGYVNAPTITATGAGGSGFAATSLLTPTTVSATFTITSGGTGYNTGDIIIFDNTDTGCVPGTIAYMNGQTPVYCVSAAATLVCNASGVITGITLINAGIGYTKKAPIISSITSINNKAGSGLNISCSLVATSVANIIISLSGSGYPTSGSAIVFTPIGAGTGASATPTIKDGCITGLNFVNVGSGYNVKAPLLTGVQQVGGTGANIIFNLVPTSVASLVITDGGTASTSASPDLSFVFTPTNAKGAGASAIPTTRATKNKTFKWNIRDLQLGRVAEIALVQIAHTNAANNTGYAIRCLETFADGFDSYNHTSAIVYLGMGLNTPSIPTYHKLISQNLNTITLLCTDDLSGSEHIYDGFNKNISFSAIFEVVDYIDEMNTY